MLRHLLLASASAIAFIGTGYAADLPSRAPPPVYVPPAPIFTWTGFYVGAQVGYGWGTTHSDFGDDFGDFASFSTQNSGVIGGGHVGYNFEFPNSQFVVGLEGSVDGSSFSKTIAGSPLIAGLFVPITIQTKQNIEGSIRGRLGWALGGLGWDRALIYATGGVAFAGVEGSISTPFGFDSASNTRVGFTVGGGLEYAWSNNWVIGVEYRYSQFSRSTFFADDAFPGVGASVDRKIDENQVQARLSYKFDTVAPAPVLVTK